MIRYSLAALLLASVSLGSSAQAQQTQSTSTQPVPLGTSLESSDDFPNRDGHLLPGSPHGILLAEVQG
jgi:hypothetical protein